MEANKPFDELTDDGGNEIAFYDFRTEKIKTGIKYTDGTEVEIPKSIICEMLMMWNRKDGKTHLLWMYQNIQQPQAVRKLHLSLLT